MEVEDDDWDLTAEELDSLERDPFQKIAQLRDSSTPPSQQFNLQQHHFLKPPSANHSQPFPPNPISDSHPQRVKFSSFLHFMLFPILYSSWGLSSFAFLFALVGLNLSFVFGRRTTHSVFVLQSRWTLCLKELEHYPPSLKPGTKKDEPSKELPKFFVKLFLHSSGHVAAKFQYDQAMFHGRLWMFPLSSLSEAEKVLGEISNYKVQLEVVKGKIKSSKSKDESESLKFTQNNLINKIYTNSADAKIPAVLEYLGTVIEAGCKFLIFAHHQPMINAIHECLLKKKVGCFWIDGGTPGVHQGNNWLQISRKRIIYIKAAVVWWYFPLCISSMCFRYKHLFCCIVIFVL
ncbi:uncharacterized protein LOC130962575 [Arachis stenosperma]|uniref:uncharacterized protein LOC130962575 n=1 Tax=Arachis stenosperma TaxID=217475 RepID=UPI0025AC63B1|nr:uncharacterized protein LOC130962575 [Arachis stenosperma]